ncbi:hypothetical protein [Acinetobacter sp. ANC 4973]|uniref:putative pilus system protein FilF n=1 Tax=Acinetobacter sp. ANC 4973 TaxID=1977871 RepID=UPI000A334582|nr:hypothetical protein [Acinetobacter sp. ANC 4973]OTG96799.1 hypothetical protein B9T30_14785 [Acinetobacter sp. ANC 4973]
MKNKYLLPFTLTTLMAALSGCGGESANITPETYDSSTANGACTPKMNGCVEFALDYPLDGLNFTCSSDTTNSFISILDLSDGAATGSCRTGDKVTFFIKGEKDKKINLGVVELNKVARLSTNQVPRLTILDMAVGITQQDAQALNKNDPTIRVAMKLVKIFQALALQENKINTPTDIQALYITDAMRSKLELILSSVTSQQIVSDEYINIIKPWVDVSVIDDDQAFEVVSKLMTIATAAVYQPEFALFSTSGVLGSLISGSDGLVGCNKEDCDLKKSDSSTKYLFGHFMLITDRQGYTFGSGLQWKGAATGDLAAISSVNAELIRKVKPVRMTALAQEHWINPINKKIDQNYQLDVADVNSQPLIISQGKLFNDYMMAGREQFYKLLTNKTTVSTEDLKDLGRWKQSTTTDEFKGSLDLYKIFPITYLDKQVFQSVSNVRSGDKYIFPMYADLTFKFTESSVPAVKLGIVIDQNGDIRSNIKSGATETDMSTSNNACTENSFDQNTFVDQYGVQQYRLGTIARAFTANKLLSIRMILAQDKFAKINGALVGMNSSIKTSSNSSTESIIVGGALLDVASLLDPTLTSGQARVTFTDSAKQPVRWGNSLASFQHVYNLANANAASDADKALATLAGGTLDFTLAPCYSIAIK